ARPCSAQPLGGDAVSGRLLIGIDVTIVEVGPRDGLQSVKQTMSTPAKLRWIDALAHTGLRHIQVGSFVSRRALP
ncbi:MAG TPA: hypothetical protein VGH92_12050, partial [Gaiellaceae bacterium]